MQLLITKTPNNVKLEYSLPTFLHNNTQYKLPRESDEQFAARRKQYIADEKEFKFNRNSYALETFFEYYWNTKKHVNFGNLFKQDPKWIEVLCSKVEVVRKVPTGTQDTIFRTNDRVVTTKTVKDVRLYTDAKILEPIESELKAKFNLRRVEGKFAETHIDFPVGTVGKIVHSQVWYGKIRSPHIRQDEIPNEKHPNRYHRLYFVPDGFTKEQMTVNLSTAVWDSDISRFVDPSTYLRKL